MNIKYSLLNNDFFYESSIVIALKNMRECDEIKGLNPHWLDGFVNWTTR